MKLSNIMFYLFVIGSVYFNWHYVNYAYNSMTLDSKIEILPLIKEIDNTYQASLNQEFIIGKPSLILINNGWTQESILEINHHQLYNNCIQEGWNLIYLSNEYGSHYYNRSRACWLNNICKNEMYGYHIYAPETFDEWEKYISNNNTEAHQFPFGLISNKEGQILDTLYSFTEIKSNLLIK